MTIRFVTVLLKHCMLYNSRYRLSDSSALQYPKNIDLSNLYIYGTSPKVLVNESSACNSIMNERNQAEEV